jgi:hypothetical protein
MAISDKKEAARIMKGENVEISGGLHEDHQTENGTTK